MVEDMTRRTSPNTIVPPLTIGAREDFDLVNFPQLVFVIELCDCRELARPFVGEEKAHVIKIHADGRVILFGMTPETPESNLSS